MKYDDAEFCFLNFETDLANEAGGTHTGMYLAWAAQRGLLGESFADARSQANVARLLAREITGRELYFDACDGKLVDADLNEQGNAFTAWYYEKQFVRDYERVFQPQIPDSGHPTDDFCSVPDTWVNCDRLTRALDHRFAQWNAARRTPPAAGAGAAVVPMKTAAPAAADPPKPASARQPLTLVEDPADVIAAIRQRAERDDAQAWFELGAEYITGERIAQDFTEAANAFTRAAQLGSIDAQFNLAVCFQRGDGRLQDLQQAMHWFLQAADGGHPDATYQLAMAYRTGATVPQDLVVSNALMLLAQAKGVSEARRAGVMAGTMAESVALLEQLRQPGQLLSTLARRRGAAPVAAGGPAGSPASPARTARRAAPPGAPASTASKLHAGHVALLIGATSLLILLAMVTTLTGAPLKVLAVVLACIGAFGVYRCSADLEHNTAVKWLLTSIALVPVAGSLVCILVLLWVVRSIQEH